METQAKDLNERIDQERGLPAGLPDSLRTVWHTRRTDVVCWLLNKLPFAAPPDHLPLAARAPHLTRDEYKLLAKHLQLKVHGDPAVELWLVRRMERYVCKRSLEGWNSDMIAYQAAMDLFQWQFDLSQIDVISALKATYGAN